MTTKKSATKKPPAARPQDAYDQCNDIGNSEHDEDVVISIINGKGTLIPVSIRRLEPRSQEFMADLQHLVLERIKIADQIDELVQESRAAGVSWVAIGWSVGTTAEAARQRWSSKIDGSPA